MRLLAVCPRISKEDATIISTTALRVRLLLLWSYYRQVRIDPVGRTISISVCYLWFCRSQRQIPFHDVEAVTYGYEDIAYHSAYEPVHETNDCFTVGLRLKDDTEVVLHDFAGDGTLVNHTFLPNWFFRPFGFDLEGSQENESRDYVEIVSCLVQVSTIPHRGY